LDPKGVSTALLVLHLITTDIGLLFIAAGSPTTKSSARQIYSTRVFVTPDQPRPFEEVNVIEATLCSQEYAWRGADLLLHPKT
jgi:hypothetical protein